jgi:hypothetical protein
VTDQVRQLISMPSSPSAKVTMLRMRPELRERAYDHVLVDEVSFAEPPDVIYAASRATRASSRRLGKAW